MRLVLFIFILNLTGLSFSQVPAVLEQTKSRILYKNGSAHIGNGDYIHNAVMAIENGKILFVKNALTYQLDESEWDTIIALGGQHIYPGFIAANITMGLTEIDAVRATRDFDEAGSINPHVRSLIAYNTDSKVLYTVRTNGVLISQSTPRGGLISGTSSVMAMDGWNWEDAVYKADDGIHVNWPKNYKQTGWWAEPGASKSNDKYASVKTELYRFFEEAQVYSQHKTHEKIYLKLAALDQVFNGEQRVYFHADYAPEINDIIDFARHFKLKHPVIIGGVDAHLLAERLKENKFAVMLGRPHALPNFEDDLTYSSYQAAAQLNRTGVLFCIQSEGDMEVMNARNLPFLAGTAWAYGLSEEEAVAAISLNVAKILGIDNRVGSLEPGKDATFFISEGNALDMRTNKVTQAMVKGRFIILDNHQIQLAKKYVDKYGLKEFKP